MEFKPKLISRTPLTEEGLIPVFEDEVEFQVGRRLKYTILEYHNAVAVVALGIDNRVLLVRVPRYPIKEYLWELPGGRIDDRESPEECAVRELEEETGYKAGHIERLAIYYPEPSFSTERLEIFMASDLVASGKVMPEREGLAEVKLFDFEDVLNMVFKGQIKSSWSIIGILFANMKLKSMLPK
jgi:ADP-ribose pyrophosphatase